MGEGRPEDTSNVIPQEPACHLAIWVKVSHWDQVFLLTIKLPGSPRGLLVSTVPAPALQAFSFPPYVCWEPNSGSHAYTTQALYSLNHFPSPLTKFWKQFYCLLVYEYKCSLQAWVLEHLVWMIQPCWKEFVIEGRTLILKTSHHS